MLNGFSSGFFVRQIVSFLVRLESNEQCIMLVAVVMILRVWAMWNRSKSILYILLTSYAREIIPSAVSCIVYSIPRHFAGKYKLTSTTPYITPTNPPARCHIAFSTHVLNLSYCTSGSNTPTWGRVSNVMQLTHATVMCTLVVARFVGQSVRTYRTTKQRQSNRLVNLLVVEGILYFLVYVLHPISPDR